MRTACAPRCLIAAMVSSILVGSVAAQSPPAVAPTLIPIEGTLTTSEGTPRTGAVLLVLSLYEAKDDPASRWVEHQLVNLDEAGNYAVQVGLTVSGGLPAELFSGPGPVQWLGVAVQNEAEQPRMMLVSVPYASKAATADTLGGKAPGDFVLHTNLATQVKEALREEASTGGEITTSAYGLNFLQKGDGLNPTDSSVIEVNGKVGIGTTSPVNQLHIGAGSDAPANGNSSLYITNNGDTAMGVRDSSANAEMTMAVDQSVGIVGTVTSHPLTLYAGGQSRMHMTAGGNIGIGTANPLQRLHVGAGADTPANGNSSVYVTNNGDTSFTVRDSTNNIEFMGGVDAGAGIVGMLTAHTLKLYAGGAAKMTILSSGNVGIGTSNPLSRFHVAGDVTVDGNIGAKYQDVAEWVDAVEPLEAGTLVVIDALATNRVIAAQDSYDSRVAGAVSAQPGVVLGEPGPGRILVAQSGRVRVKADASTGAIRPGDILVSSATKGHVMRSHPMTFNGQPFHRPGTVVGKALEALPAGRGEILVLLTLQ